MSAVPVLSVDNLSVEFKTRGGIVKALEQVSFSVAKGEMVAIVGESGSGKSVTAYTVMGILDAAGRVSSGTATFGGLDLLQAKENVLREIRGREISMIFQNPRVALNPIRRVGDQIADVLLQHGNVTRREAPQRAIEMLTRVRIPDPERRAKAYPFELSGGMCQRIMIAIALSCSPKMLIADEPTTGLDVTTQAAIMDLIAELGADQGMATLLITHDLGMAAEYCDQIVVMHAGHIVEAASTAALFANPRHPYTAKLIAATPRPTASLAELAAIPGNLPDLRAAEIPTCRYSLRCERRQSRCTQALPRALTDGEQHGCLLEPPMSSMFDKPLLDAQSLHKHFPVGKKTGALFTRKSTAKSTAMLHAVDDVTFTIGKGETLGLVGESGCGKSTLVRLLTRLLDLTDGSIHLNGEEIGHLPAKGFGSSPYRPRIQMVFQDAGDSLNPRFTAFAAIADPIQRLKPLGRAALKTRVEALAAMCGLPAELLGRFPHQLSGGQKARVGIARAIAVEPDLLILDEPTAALDVSVQVVILQLLEDLKQRLGMSYLFVSHDLNVVRLLCDRVMVMYLGKIVETGPAEAVFRNPAHPYTKALLSAIPHFDQIKGGGGAPAQRLRISGEPRSPIDPSPNVCRFHGRCPKSQPACEESMPLLQGVGPGHSVACHFPVAGNDTAPRTTPGAAAAE